MDKDIANYRKDGFMLLKGFFSPGRIGKVLMDAKRIFHIQFLHKGYTSAALDSMSDREFNECLFRLFREDFTCLSNCGKHAQHLISLHRLSLEESLISLLEKTGMTFPNISTRPVLYFNHPNVAQKKVYHTVDAHQDWRSMQGSLNSMVIWIPLTDIDNTLGALQVIPGSHLWGLKSEALSDGFGMVDFSGKENDFISVEVKCGDILAFSSFLVHRSGVNSSDSPRWSCHFRYNDMGEKTFIERGFPHPYIYKPVEELISPGFPKQEDLNKIFSA